MKKFLAILLTLLMVLPVFSVMVVAEAAPDQNAEPGSEAYTAWLKSEGYTAISSYAELKAITDFSATAKYYFSADITTDGVTEYALNTSTFLGTIDGNGHTLYNWKQNFVEDFGGTLRNVTFSKYVAEDSTTAVVREGNGVKKNGVVSGWFLSGTLIENVVNNVEFGEVANAIGSFAYAVCGGDNPIILRNCVNNGSFDSKYQSNNHKVGGLIGGTHNDGATVIFENCVNNGNVRASQAGGLFGVIGNKLSVTFINCTNNGKIEATTGSTGYGISGGFIASINNGSSIDKEVSITFENCTNTGDVLRYDAGSNTKTARQGGFMGYLINNAKTTLTIRNSTVKDCTIDGRGTNNTAEWGEAAGLVGKIKSSSAETTVTVQNCTVSNVTIEAKEGKFAFVRVALVDTVVLENCVANNVVNANGEEVAVTQKDNDGKSVLKFTEESEVVSINKAQQSVANADGKTAVRFIGTVNSLGFAQIGYYIELNGKTIKLTTDVVYNSLNANYGESQITAESLNAAFLTAVVMNDVTADFNGTINVTPFVKAEDGTYTYGKTKSISFTNGAIGECL